jgi:hypothetical protein
MAKAEIWKTESKNDHSGRSGPKVGSQLLPHPAYDFKEVDWGGVLKS